MSTSEEYQLPAEEDLRKLSRYAVVTYAVCAARMVQPLFGYGDYQPPLEHIKAVDEAIWIAELFVQKRISSTEDSKIAYTASNGYADETFDIARSAHANFAAHAAYAAAHAAYAYTAANRFAETAATDARSAADAAAEAATRADADATDIIHSLSIIYKRLKEYYPHGSTDPINFSIISNFNIWKNGNPPQWFIDFIRRNEQLKRYWDDNDLNPWNMLKISKGISDITFHVTLPSLKKTVVTTATFVERLSLNDFAEAHLEPRLSIHTPTADTISFGTKPEISSNSNHDHDSCLGIDHIAAALGDVLIHSKDSLCVGILGQWGCGKSRLMKEVTEHFKGAHEIERLVTIKYNAWKYRNSPESWAYLYECFAEKLRVTSWFAMIRAGVICHQLWPIILALFFISLPWFILQLPFSKSIESITFEQVDWGTRFLRLIGFGGGSAILLFFLKQLHQSAFSIEKRSTLPNHHDKLGLQAALGDDFHALIRGWTTIKPGEHFFSGQSSTAGIVKIILYVTLWITAFLSFQHLLAQFDQSIPLSLLAATFLAVTLLPGVLFIPILKEWVGYWYQDEKNHIKIKSVKDFIQSHWAIEMLSCFIVSGYGIATLTQVRQSPPYGKNFAKIFSYPNGQFSFILTHFSAKHSEIMINQVQIAAFFFQSRCSQEKFLALTLAR